MGISLVPYAAKEPKTKDPKTKEPKKTQYSYTRLDKYTECGYRYKLVYEDKNYISETGVAAAVGTLVHYIEETIANCIIDAVTVSVHDQPRDQCMTCHMISV